MKYLFSSIFVMLFALLGILVCTQTEDLPPYKQIGWCQVDITDGEIFIDKDGTPTSFVMDEKGFIWSEGQFVPCKYLKRYKNT